MPDVILLNELTDKINELNSDLESDINSINSNVTAVGSSLSSKIDALSTDLSASVNTVKTATATNNTASLTGTLSQKLSYIANTLIGTTGATGGTDTTGTVMAKLNTLYKLLTGKYVTKTFSQSGPTTATTFGTLNNIIYIGSNVGVYGYETSSNSYFSYCDVIADGVTIHSLEDYGESWTYSSARGVKSTNYGNFAPPYYVSSLTVKGYGERSYCEQKVTIAYIQL